MGRRCRNERNDFFEGETKMKRTIILMAIAIGLVVGGVAQSAEKKHGREETKKVAYLGVATESVDPQLSRHLKLRPGEGLEVQMVDEKSPAAGIIKEEDILKELNGQWLVNPEQLRTVVRMMKAGDEVKITLIRDGDVKNVSVKLGEREVSLQEEMQSQMGRGMQGMQGMMSPEEMMQMMQGMRGGMPRKFHQWQQGNPAEEDDKDSKAESENKVEVSPGDAKTSVSVSSSTTIMKDGHAVTLTNNNGDKRLVVKKGSKTLFDGPVSTDEQVKALSKDIREFYDEVAKGGPSIKIKTQSSADKPRVDI
jgi:hypothetical protein